ncbi:Death ligand signal enhancer [Holothuria leucospilota]|uniref:Death ligand signal enhancer n=1 Tax=Holothuria leucospilota TaxID=206669 RepID=A0A9Q1BKV8_HOLLE|nr:Death ligand signal enhancer [Holothuria leucospilota]
MPIMQKIIHNLPKILRGHKPCSSNNVHTSFPSSPLQNADSTDHSKENKLLCARSPGHVRVFSWLPGVNPQRFCDHFYFVLDKSEREFGQRNRWQSNREEGSASQAFGWGTAVVVAIQLCRALSVAKFPDSDSKSGNRSPLLTAAQLLPAPRFSHGIAKNILSDSEGDGDSDIESSTSFSVSFDETSDDTASQSAASQTATSLSEDESEEQKTAKVHHQSTTPAEDVIIPTLKVALSCLDEAYQRTQGRVETMIGVQYARIGNYDKAVEHFKVGCKLGYSKAQFNLGLCFELGKGVKSDMSKAAELYQQAAQQGHPLAIYNLGVYSCHGFGGIPQDEKEGVSLMEKAAAGGVVLADSFLGSYYLQARNRNIHKAIFHLKRAAEEEDTESQYLLGLCYEQGWGVHSNKRKAAQLYHKSAEKGYPLAIYSMGLYYEKGLGGVIKDRKQAKKYYIAASESGLDLAKEKLEMFSKSEVQTKPDRDGSGDTCIKTAELVPGSTLRFHQKSNSLHTSNSEPVLQCNVNETQTAEKTTNIPKLSYLSLILPSLLNTGRVRIGDASGDIRQDRNENRVNFQVGDEDEIAPSSWQKEHWETLQLVV